MKLDRFYSFVLAANVLAMAVLVALRSGHWIGIVHVINGAVAAAVIWTNRERGIASEVSSVGGLK